MEPTTIFILNARTGIVHSSIDGRKYEQCNTDQLVDAIAAPTLDELRLKHDKPLRFCKRCFPGGAA